MSASSNITAAILAGGFGTRLRAVVSDRPKVLAEVGGRPFIEYLLDQLAADSVRSVVLCTGYLGNQIRSLLGATYKGIALHYSCEPCPMGTGGALRLALPMLESDPVLVLNGDSYCDVQLNQFVNWHADLKSLATIVLSQTNDTQRYGRVEIDPNGRVLRFSEKIESQDPGWISAGIYLLSREVIESIPADSNVSLEREIFPKWIGRGLHGFGSRGRVWDIGVPDAYVEANTGFISSLSKRPIL